MDKRRIIKFFPQSGDTAAEVGKLISIMGEDGYQLMSFTLNPSSAATLVFERPAEQLGAVSPAGSDVGAGA